MGVAELRQVVPVGVKLQFALDPKQITQGGGVGGWSEIGHVKRPSSVEFEGTPLRTLTVPLMLDGWTGNRFWARRDGARIDVEETCRILEALGRPPGGRVEPPVLQFVYGPHTPLRWVLNGLDWGAELRNASARRVRAEVTLQLLEYRDTVLTVSPAKRVAAPSSTAKPSGRVYTVKAGDTLSKIAQAQLGKTSRWQEIARVNGLPLAAVIRVGQKLRLPA